MEVRIGLLPRGPDVFELDPHWGMIAGFFPRAHVAIDSCRFEPLGDSRA